MQRASITSILLAYIHYRWSKMLSYSCHTCELRLSLDDFRSFSLARSWSLSSDTPVINPNVWTKCWTISGLVSTLNDLDSERLIGNSSESDSFSTSWFTFLSFFKLSTIVNFLVLCACVSLGTWNRVIISLVFEL